MGSRTKKSHFIPAAWTALWNPEYFTDPAGRIAREQSLFVLNLRSRKVHAARAGEVFCQNGLLQADITREWAEEAFGNDGVLHRAEVQQDLDEKFQAGPLIADWEELCSALESGPHFSTAMHIAGKRQIASSEEREFLAVFIAVMELRSPEVLQIAERAAQTKLDGIDAWAGMFRDGEMLRRRSMQLSQANWILHVADQHTFPLSDRPLLKSNESRQWWFPLSPRLLIEMEMPGDAAMSWSVCAGNVACGAQKQYARACLQGAKTQIVFHDRGVLESWLSTLPEPLSGGE